ncbi:MAG: hypothetical protein ACI4QE_01945 [Acutalibacteraceae bacterium]
MFGNKKNDNNNGQNENITPRDLNELSRKHALQVAKEKQYGRFEARRDAVRIGKWTRRRFILFIVTIALVALLFALWALGAVMSMLGDMTIELDRKLDAAGIVLCENSNFEEPKSLLTGTKVEDATNITYNWLPEKLDEYVSKKDKNIDGGSHNGKNYIAYTFYIKNIGDKAVDYTATLSTLGVAKNVDEAVRVMVYKNGEPTIYAKPQYNKKGRKPEDDSSFITDGTKEEMFLSDSDIMKSRSKDFAKNDVDKYTIVMWIEGNDPQCVDAVMGGHMRMKMVFEATKKGTDSLSN